jgi:type I restriction enzyme S subunit
MKSDWRKARATLRVALGDVCTIKYGKDHKCLADGKIPVYGSGGIMRYVDAAIYDKKSVLIPRKGSLGNLYFVDEPFWTVDTCFYTEIDETKVVSEFLYFKLKMLDLVKMNVGSAVPSLTTAVLNEIKLDLPPLPAQRAIAATLSCLDDKIELNRRINANLEAQAQAIFKSWFVDFEPWGGVMPAGWTTGKAEDFFDISIGKTPPRKETQWFTANPQDVVWVSISDMGSCGVFISDSSEYLTAESLSRFNIKVVPSGAVLLSFKLTIGRVAITNGEMTTNEAIAHFKRQEDTATEHLYCYLKAFDYQSLGNTSSIGTAVNSKTIKAMPFVMPDGKTIEKFHASTAPLFEQIRVHLEESARLAAIRDTLLPRLMSGEIRPPEGL